MPENEQFFRGGLHTGIWYITYPFASISIIRGAVEIRIFGKVKYSFKPEQITGFKIRKGGIQIYHMIQQYPSLIFFGGSGREINDALLSAGFSTTDIQSLDESDWKLQKYVTIAGFFMMLLFISMTVAIIMLSN